MDNSKIALKGERAQRLRALANQPGWTDLQELAERGKAKFERELVAATWRGEAVNQAWLREKVAFIKALEFLLKQPDKAESSFELAARKEGTD